MANLIRWDPFRDLMDMRREWDRLFDNSFLAPMTTNGWHAPRVDMYQTDNDMVIEAAMPGIKSEDVDIQVTGDMVTIKAERKEEKERNDATYHLREQRYQSYARSLMLPVPVKADKANAEVKDGVLHLTLPKAEEAKAKTITIKAK
ncbi:MAG: Hsp20/alpha crystallin family protein [Anaerolineales bacterium]